MVEEDKDAAGFLRDYDLKRLPESCAYTKDLDPKEVLKLAAEMCAEQGDQERLQIVRDKLVAAYRSELEVGTNDDLTQFWAMIQNNLGTALRELGTRSGDKEEGYKRLEDAVAAYRSSLEAYARADLPQDWARTQKNLGIALQELGRRSGDKEEGYKRLEDAVAAYRAALEGYTKADMPQDGAVIQDSLGVALQELGKRSGDKEQGDKRLQEAVAAYRAALEGYTKADFPQDLARTQNSLGIALQELWRRSGDKEESRRLLEEAVAAYRSALEVWTKADMPQDWARTQNNLGAALQELGRRSGDKEGYKLLEDAVAAYRSALEVWTKADMPQDWAVIQDNLGMALQELGKRSSDKEEGDKLLEDAVAAYRSALEVRTKPDLPQNWAKTQNNLGTALRELGRRSGDKEQGGKLLQEAIAVYRSALEVSTKADLPQDWARIQNNLGTALKELGKRNGDKEEGDKLLEDAVAAYRSALEVYTKADLPQDWAGTQNNLGTALQELGMPNAGEESRKLLEGAVAAYRAALEVYTKVDLPQNWARTQNNLGTALQELGTPNAGEESRKLLEEAVAAYRSALEVWTKADLPQNWARTQNNLGTALQELWRRSGDKEEGRKLLEEAVAAYRSALEVWTKADLPQNWARTQNDLGAALRELGKRSGDKEEADKLLEGAAAAYRASLEVYTKADLPQNWARTQNNLGTALQELGTSSAGEQHRKLLEGAVAAYRAALEVYTRADLPQNWARTQNNLSDALSALDNQLGGEEVLKRKREAVELRRDLMSYQPDDQSRYRLASALGDLAFHLVLNSQFAEAKARCEEAQGLASDIRDGMEKETRDRLVIFIQRNLAHALLFLARSDEAFAIYRKNWNEAVDGKTFREVTLEDFVAFDKAALTHPDLSRMKRALGDLDSQERAFQTKEGEPKKRK